MFFMDVVKFVCNFSDVFSKFINYFFLVLFILVCFILCDNKDFIG